MNLYEQFLKQANEKAAAAKTLLEGENPDMEQIKALQAEALAFQEKAQAAKAIGNIADETGKALDAHGKAKAEPPTNGGLVVTKDETDKKLEAGPPYKSLGDFLIDVWRFQDNLGAPEAQMLRAISSADGINVGKAIGYGKVGSLHHAKAAHVSRQVASKAISGLSELVPADGGLLVGTDRNMNIISRMYGTGQLLQMINIIPISSTSNSLRLFGEEETSRADGSRRGGIQAHWEVEGGLKSGSKPKFRDINLMLHKIIGLVYATDEVLADAPALEGWIMQHLPEELRFKAEDGIVRGTGVGMPQGLISAPGRVTVGAEVGQAADTVVSENIINMWARRWVRANDYVWLVNQDVTPQLHQMNLPVGTGGALVYMPPGGLSQSPYGTLYSRPVMEVEYCSTVGTEGDIILFSPSQYQGADKGGIQSAVSMHVRFIYDEQVFRFVYRFDAQPLFGSELTPYQGNNTVSGYVTLADRD